MIKILNITLSCLVGLFLVSCKKDFAPSPHHKTKTPIITPIQTGTITPVFTRTAIPLTIIIPPKLHEIIHPIFHPPASFTITRTPEPTFTFSHTVTPTFALSFTSTRTPITVPTPFEIPTITVTPTITSIPVFSHTITSTPTFVPIPTVTRTSTSAPVPTSTSTPAATPTSTAVLTSTFTATLVSTHTITPTLTISPTHTHTSTIAFFFTPTITPTITPEPKRVFLTSETFPGDFGGLSGADALCQTAASNAGLTGSWKSWLSDSTTDAKDRLTDVGPWFLLDGTKIANNLADLLDGSINATISIDELGVFHPQGEPNIEAWTATDCNGFGTVDHCSDWTVMSGPLGDTGFPTAIDCAWTEGSFNLCSSPGHLYCFEM